MTQVYNPLDFYWHKDDPYSASSTNPSDPLQRRALTLIGCSGNCNAHGGADLVAFLGDQIVIATVMPLGCPGDRLGLVIRPLVEFVRDYSESLECEIGRDELAELLDKGIVA